MPLKPDVVYCSVVSKTGRPLHSYSNGDRETENLACLCLSMAPPHHRWYLQTAAKTTIGFLMDDGYIYFAIVKEREADDTANSRGVRNSPILKFLHQLRDDFTRSSSLKSLSLQERRLHPVVRRSMASFEKINSTPCGGRLDASSLVSYPLQQQSEGNFSMEAPLLGRSEKAIEMDEACSSSIASFELEQGKNAFTESVNSERSSRNSSSRRRLCRLAVIILAIDAGICFVLLIIWLFICRGWLKCRP
ncbi:hypothetical protein M569_01235 [Genlisea aurea]|uniref:Longin domain-containing protein n=1 Tax=Genlisea aurea TaxID=192259 RepID=S8ELJ8_9LAMI|nr:hypothetical protein M569_01235 [Genlisea aurea]